MKNSFNEPRMSTSMGCGLCVLVHPEEENQAAREENGSD